MSDHITNNLADRGYNVVKYVPYGEVKTMMPYLFRAEENSLSKGTNLKRGVKPYIGRNKKKETKQISHLYNSSFQ